MTHQPLQVVAHLASGVAHAAPWTVSLDGLLASQLRSRQPHQQRTTLDTINPPDLPLPLDRCELDTGHWHWAATCGWPDTAPERPDMRYWTTRLDQRHTGLTAEGPLPHHLHDHKGRYKAFRVPVPTTVALHLTWYAIGDRHTITDLLSGVHSIGKKRSMGEGRVLRWDIAPAPHLDRYTAAHLSPTGALARPCPPGCLEAHPNIVTGGRGYAAIRPPHMHPSRRTDVYLPA